jgi:DNA-binding LacI/PurR family transcriptional regulator
MIGYSWESEKHKHSNQVLDTFLTSMVEEAEDAGYHLLPFPFHTGENLTAGYRALIDSGRVDGFIISSINYHDLRAKYLLERQFPFVAFGCSSPDLDFPYVDVDGAMGLRMATEHLIARGHRRIAALAWPETSRVGNDRFDGYRAALKAAGLPLDPQLVSHEEGAFENARTTTERWLALDSDRRPTGIVAFTDIMAIGAMQAGQARGLTIGTDLAIIGFDNSPLAEYLSPSLSTINQPIRAVGHKCVEMLVTLLKNKELNERHVLLQPELIIRASA